MKKIYTIILLLVSILVLSSCATSDTSGESAVPEPVIAESVQPSSSGERSVAEKETEAVKKEDVVEVDDDYIGDDDDAHGLFVSGLLGFWHGVTATRHFFKGLMPDWW